jgi:dTDP-4-dehydrorhamnose reductase
VSRKTEINSIRFDAIENDLGILNLRDNFYDYVINCIGIIRHRITESNESIKRAILVNSIFPLKLLKEIEGSPTKLIQIGTDCVFSGRAGSYSESAVKDPIDFYGYSKAMGEISSQNQMLLRCSIIGRENENHLSLMEWLLRQAKNSKVNGFIDHKWNGLTTLAFAKILNGIISQEHFESGVFHVVPGNQVTKFELLQIIASTFRRGDLHIYPTSSSAPVDRTLSTGFIKENERFWESANYGHIPTIQDMLREYEIHIRKLLSE